MEEKEGGGKERDVEEGRTGETELMFTKRPEVKLVMEYRLEECD